MPGPVHLLADSQVLFWTRGGEPWPATLLRGAAGDPPRAAYVGASNGDDPAFFALFAAAMEYAGQVECSAIAAHPSA